MCGLGVGYVCIERAESMLEQTELSQSGARGLGCVHLQDVSDRAQ